MTLHLIMMSWKTILNFDETEYERKCEEYLKTIGYFDDGHAAEAVVDVILEKAGLL